MIVELRLVAYVFIGLFAFANMRTEWIVLDVAGCTCLVLLACMFELVRIDGGFE